MNTPYNGFQHASPLAGQAGNAAGGQAQGGYQTGAGYQSGAGYQTGTGYQAGAGYAAQPMAGVYSGAPYGQPQAYAQQPAPGLVSPAMQRFLTGALIGAAAAYVLTNENVQNSLIKSTVRVWDLMQGGVEEVKERFRDAEAEIKAEKAAAGE